MALRIRLSAAGLHEDMLEYAASMVETMLEDSGTEVEDLVEILFPLFMDAESTTITDEAACRIFAEELMGKGSSSSGGGAAAGAASGAVAAPVAAVPPAERIAAALIAACPALEATMVEYVSSLAAGMMDDAMAVSEDLAEIVFPLLQDNGWGGDEAECLALCSTLLNKKTAGAGKDDELRLLAEKTTMQSLIDVHSVTAEERIKMLGIDKVRETVNEHEVFVLSEKKRKQYIKRDLQSKDAAERRRAKADAEALEALGDMSGAATSDRGILPGDAGSGSGGGGRDVQCEHVTINWGGKELLTDTTLRLVFGHRYGFVGMNGVGKSTYNIIYFTSSV